MSFPFWAASGVLNQHCCAVDALMGDKHDTLNLTSDIQVKIILCNAEFQSAVNHCSTIVTSACLMTESVSF